MIQRLALSWHRGKAFNLTPFTYSFIHCPVLARSSTQVIRHPLLSSRSQREGTGLSFKFDVKFGIVNMSDYPFCADYDKRGMAKCKGCKQKCEKESLRLGKITANPFKTGETMKVWYHPKCLFESFKKARATTKRIEDLEDDVENWDAVEKDDRSELRAMLEDTQDFWEKKLGAAAKKPTPKKKVQPPAAAPAPTPASPASSPGPKPSTSRNDPPTDRKHKDNSFKEFRRLCLALVSETSYLNKTKLVANYFKHGSDKDGFKGDLRLWVKLLLPGVVKRVYNLRSKQLLKLYSQIFNTNLEEMTEDLEQGDVAETIGKFFETSRQLPPIKKSILSLQDVDEALEELSGKTREEDQSITLRAIAKKSTGNDLRMVIRLIKGDLAIGAGAKHILEGVHKEAYEAFQMTRNIDSVMDSIISGDKTVSKLSAQLLTPFLPMLAAPCKSVEQAFKKCPSGVMYAEVKYDGERVQLHKSGQDYKFFSRSLKPVVPYKVDHFMEFIPKAFKEASNLVLDAEVLMVCTKTGKPLPFGTLGKNKQQDESLKYAQPCLYVFDCLHYNGRDLMKMPIIDRRAILEKTMKEVKHRIMFSEMKKIDNPKDLLNLIERVLEQGLEGLVLKDIKSVYEPGKRHWLKVKKDYLNDGAMADTADLVVLGAWYGTGKKGGKMSVFLMGCYDKRIDKWRTVTKVHTGHDDAALERLQTELDMVKISQDVTRVPRWLLVNKSMVPDFVAADPKRSPVWEVTGAQFTRHQIHTADGISIRFPRVSRERDDKDWKSATSLSQLQDLYEASNDCVNLDGLGGPDDEEEEETEVVEEEEMEEEVVANTSKTSKRSSLPSSSPSLSPTKKDDSSRKKKRERDDTEDSPKKRKNEGKETKHDGEKYKKIDQIIKKDDSSRKKKREGDETKEDSTKKRKSEDKGTKQEDGEKHKQIDQSTKKPLTIFNRVVVRFSDHLPRKECAFLQRYVYAYGGDVVPSYDAEHVTHFIATSKDTEPYDGPGVKVKVQWLRDCIKGKTLLSTHQYKP